MLLKIISIFILVVCWSFLETQFSFAIVVEFPEIEQLELSDASTISTMTSSTTTTTINPETKSIGTITTTECVIYINVSPPEGGTTSPPPGRHISFGCGIRYLDITAIPYSGYEFSHWEGCKDAKDNPITVDMMSCWEITAIFTTSAVSSTTTTCSEPCCIEEIYSEHSEEVELLRYIRDNVLSQTPEGQEIISLYYQWSPAIVKAMEEDEGFKEEVKEMVDVVLMLIGGGVE